MVLNSIAIFPTETLALDNSYEFENGIISDTGENVTETIALTNANNGQAVFLKDGGDSVTMKINADKSGVQTLRIRYSQPFDENGKYQNVIVNGVNIGEIFCAYTGEGNFGTATISANLKSGSNTVTIEGTWGWTFLDSLTIDSTDNQSAYANPVISHGVPAYSGSSSASSGNDGIYYTFWESTSGDYLAYDLSSVPQNQRKKVIAVWYNLSTYDNVGIYVNKSNEPVNYTIEINSANGGKYPDSGWEIAETVSDNGLSSRQHLIDMDGYNWIRIKVTKTNGNKVILNFDIHNASESVSDSWIFFGDSITAGGMGNAYGTSYASYINQLDSRFFPVQENGGIGGTTSRDGKNNIDKWLSVSPAKYVGIAYGTNDAWGNPNNVDSYYANTKYMIDAVIKAGKIPVIPKIPYATNSDVGSNIGYYNAVIDKLYNEYGDKIVHGPDFDAYFRENPFGLSNDGVHPNSDGYEAMRKLWAETMYQNVYSNFTEETNNFDDNYIKGDVNSDETVNVADLVMMQKYLLGGGTLTNWQAGDLYNDSIIDSFDMIEMRKLIIQKLSSDNT